MVLFYGFKLMPILNIAGIYKFSLLHFVVNGGWRDRVLLAGAERRIE
jgi:hypothetical protein